MIGSFVMLKGSEFIMGDNGVWSGPDKMTVKLLNAKYLGVETTPIDNPARQVRLAAAAYKVKPYIERKKQPVGKFRCVDGWASDIDPMMAK